MDMAITLKDYVNEYYAGNWSAWAEHVGVQNNVDRYKKGDYIYAFGKLYIRSKGGNKE